MFGRVLVSDRAGLAQTGRGTAMADEPNMAGSGNPQPASPPTSHTAVAGTVGAVGGAGISLALFTTLHVDRIVQNSAFGPSYAIAIFSAVAFFVLIAGILALPSAITADRSRYIWGGVIVFGLMTLASASPIVTGGFSTQIAIVQGSFNPDLGAFRDPDTTPVVLIAKAYSDQQPITLTDVPTALPLRSGQTLMIKIEKLDDLEYKYQQKFADLQKARQAARAFQTTIDAICKANASVTDPACVFSRQNPSDDNTD